MIVATQMVLFLRERILHRFRSLNTKANGMLPIIINTTITITVKYCELIDCQVSIVGDCSAPPGNIQGFLNSP